MVKDITALERVDRVIETIDRSIDMVKMLMLEDGKPCGIHPNCERHVLTPCEGCGRKGMVSNNG